jgi:hypothetical protein
MAGIEAGGSPGRYALTRLIGPAWSLADEVAYYALPRRPSWRRLNYEVGIKPGTVQQMTKAKGEEEGGDSPSRLIDARIKELGDWRGETLARIRKLIRQADPDVVEEWKWRGVPVWYHDGMICTGETYKNVVKVTFAKGASLEDPAGLFNSSLDGNTRRAIDFHEGDKIDEKALKALIRAAVALNTS